VPSLPLTEVPAKRHLLLPTLTCIATAATHFHTREPAAAGVTWRRRQDGGRSQSQRIVSGTALAPAFDFRTSRDSESTARELLQARLVREPEPAGFERSFAARYGLRAGRSLLAFRGL